MKQLSKLEIGEISHISHILSTDTMRRRLQDLGLIEGTAIECLYKSPWGDPVAYLIKGAAIALRNEDANNIIVDSNL